MAKQKQKKTLNTKIFREQFVRGASEEELRERFELSQALLPRVVSQLKSLGLITHKEIRERQENLRIRFGEGDPTADPSKAQKVEVDLDTGLVLHCPSCGASVKRGADDCDYCGSHLDFSLTGKTMHCPHCYARIAAESRFCARCAQPLKRQVKKGQVLADRLCPRCRKPLIGTKAGDFEVMGCDACAGMFIPHDTFEMMQDTSSRHIETTQRIPRQPTVKMEDTVSYVRCPVCRQMMNRQNFARISGVIIDTCGKHGVWFDAGELEGIMDFLARGGLQKARERELEHQKLEQKLAGLRQEPRGTMMGTGDMELGLIGALGRKGPAGIGEFPMDAGPDLMELIGGIWGLFKR